MRKSTAFFILIIGSLFYTSAGFAQDVIFKKNGEEVKSKVIEVDKNEITFKTFDDPEFSSQKIKIQEVVKIRYEDGTEKIFPPKIPHYLGIGLGSSMPMGDFKSINISNPEAGYALPGGHLKIEVGFYIFRNLGLAASIGGFNNQLDSSRFIEPYKNVPRV
ncbi:MAG: hypothetical protein K2X86_03615, partial [Cytophagaceae bacterium]|nr:hypothetical protein [Cytophagaceae bacterium]